MSLGDCLLKLQETVLKLLRAPRGLPTDCRTVKTGILSLSHGPLLPTHVGPTVGRDMEQSQATGGDHHPGRGAPSMPHVARFVLWLIVPSIMKLNLWGAPPHRSGPQSSLPPSKVEFLGSLSPGILGRLANALQSGARGLAQRKLRKWMLGTVSEREWGQRKLSSDVRSPWGGG